MPEKGAAADVADVDITPKELLKNPKKAGKKVLGVLEMGGGATLSGMADKAMRPYVKNDTVRDVGRMLGGMFAAGAIKQKDASNVAAGFAVAPAERLGHKIFEFLKKLVRKGSTAVAQVAAPRPAPVPRTRQVARRGYAARRRRR